MLDLIQIFFYIIFSYFITILIKCIIYSVNTKYKLKKNLPDADLNHSHTDYYYHHFVITNN